MKMAIVQAGTEVMNLQQQHEAYVRDADAQMEKLLLGQQEALRCKERLTAARSQLAVYETSHNEKIKKILMTFTGGSGTALLRGIFVGWTTYVKKMKVENTIFKEYKER